MNKGEVSVENINNYCDNYKLIFTEMDNAYRCMRTLKVTNNLIFKTKDHICKIMLLWRELTLNVTPSAHLFEGHILYQMEYTVGGVADKKDDHFERSHQDSKRSEIMYCELTNFKQSQIS